LPSHHSVSDAMASNARSGRPMDVHGQVFRE
jgi:hypothetical protein